MSNYVNLTNTVDPSQCKPKLVPAGTYGRCSVPNNPQEIYLWGPYITKGFPNMGPTNVKCYKHIEQKTCPHKNINYTWPYYTKEVDCVYKYEDFKGYYLTLKNNGDTCWVIGGPQRGTTYLSDGEPHGYDVN